jgi:hypothetical protein
MNREFRIRGSSLEIRLVPANAVYRVLKGPSLTFHHSGEEVELTSNLPEAICPYADQEST